MTKYYTLKSDLIREFCNGFHAQHNLNRINYVMRIYRKQTRRINTNEAKVINRLQQYGVEYKTQTPIPILSSGGKLEHLYLADIVVGKTIIEVDGPQHKKSYDKERDRQTSSQGYKTIRIPTSDLSAETIDSYLRELY